MIVNFLDSPLSYQLRTEIHFVADVRTLVCFSFFLSPVSYQASSRDREGSGKGKDFTQERISTIRTFVLSRFHYNQYYFSIVLLC